MSTKLESDFPKELGNLIFKDEQHGSNPILVALVSCVIGLALATLHYFDGHDPVPSLAFFVFAAPGAIYAIVHLRRATGSRKLLLFENAIVLKNDGTTKTLMLEELDKFRCLRTPFYHDGTHWGDKFEMSFEARPGSDQDKILYSARNYCSHFDRLLDVVSEKMSLNLTADLAEDGNVEWVNQVLILQEGINAPVNSMNGLSQRFVHWSEISEFDIEEGQLKIKLVNSEWSVEKIDGIAKLACSEINFYPGYFLFRQLYRLNKGESVQGAMSSTAAQNEQAN